MKEDSSDHHHHRHFGRKQIANTVARSPLALYPGRFFNERPGYEARSPTPRAVLASLYQPHKCLFPVEARICKLHKKLLKASNVVNTSDVGCCQLCILWKMKVWNWVYPLWIPLPSRGWNNNNYPLRNIDLTIGKKYGEHDWVGETSAWIATFAFPWQPVSKHMVTPYTNHDVDTPVEV